jgi:hypothetical protein
MAATGDTTDQSRDKKPISEMEFMSKGECSEIFQEGVDAFLQETMVQIQFNSMDECENYVFTFLITRGLQHRLPNVTMDQSYHDSNKILQDIQKDYKKCLRTLYRNLHRTQFEQKHELFKDINIDKNLNCAFMSGLLMDNREWVRRHGTQSSTNECDLVLHQRTTLFKILDSFTIAPMRNDIRTEMLSQLSNTPLPLSNDAFHLFVLWLQLMRWLPETTVANEIFTSDESAAFCPRTEKIVAYCNNAARNIVDSPALQTLKMDYLCRFWHMYSPTASSFVSVAVHASDSSDVMYAAADILHVMQCEVVIQTAASNSITVSISEDIMNEKVTPQRTTRKEGVWNELVFLGELNAIYWQDVSVNGMRPGHDPFPITDNHMQHVKRKDSVPRSCPQVQEPHSLPSSIVASNGLMRWRNSETMRNAIQECTDADIVNDYALTSDDMLIAEVYSANYQV